MEYLCMYIYHISQKLGTMFGFFLAYALFGRTLSIGSWLYNFQVKSNKKRTTSMDKLSL